MERLFNNTLSLSGIVLFTGAFVHLILHPSGLPFDKLAQKFAHLMVIYVGIFMITMGRRHRRGYSEVMEFLNERSLKVLQREDALTHRPKRNGIFLAMVMTLLLTGIAGLFSPLAFLSEPIFEGTIYFKNVLPFDNTPYSVQVYAQAALQVLLFYWIYIYSGLFIVIVIEPFLQLSLCYKVIATDLRALRSKPGFQEQEELEKLKALMIDISEINRLWAQEELKKRWR